MPESLEQMLKRAEEGSRGNVMLAPTFDRLFVIELIAAVRAALSPSLGEGELPPLDRSNFGPGVPDWDEAQRKYGGNSVQFQGMFLIQRECQLHIAYAEIGRLKGENEHLRRYANLCPEHESDMLRGHMPSANCFRCTLSHCTTKRYQAESALATAKAQLDKMRGLADMATEGMERANKLYATAKEEHCVAIGKAVDVAIGEFQDGVYQVLRKQCGDSIDGGGCDSGDPLDFTIAEIYQALDIKFESGKLEGRKEMKTQALEAVRDLYTDEDDMQTGKANQAAEQAILAIPDAK